jgi:hypothetical protein
MNAKELMRDIEALRSTGCTKIAATVLHHPHPQRYRIVGIGRPSYYDRDTIFLELVKDDSDA